MAKFLVTGATGHLGAWLVRDLVGNGHEVRALARRTSDRRGIEGIGAEVVLGDLLDSNSLRAAVAGMDAVMHAGAVHRNLTADPDELLQASVRGTSRLLAVAAEAGVRRFVHTSSNATIGYGQDASRPLDESSRMRDPVSPYIRGKVLAEAEALVGGANLGLEVVVVNPCGLLGPWDLRVTPTTKAIVNLCRGAPTVVDVSLTHVEDVAIGHRLAWERGVAGQRYILAGDLGTRERVAEAMTGLLGRRIRAVRPPYAAVWAMAAAQEALFALGGAEPDITRAMLQDVGASGHLLYDASRARRELGWSARPLVDTLRDTVRWLAWTGRLPEEVAAPLRARWGPDAGWPTG